MTSRRILKFIALMTVVVCFTGCASTRGYLVDRGRDSMDIFTATAGAGLGAQIRLGPTPFGFLETTDATGVRYGDVFSRSPVADEGPEEENHRLLAVLVAVPSFILFDGDVEPVGSCWEHCYDRFPMNEVQLSRNKDAKGPRSPSFYQTEVAVGLGLILRAGVNVAELLDFVLGFATVDIFNDDLEKRAKKRAEEYPSFSFGAVADCQYCAVEEAGVRKYALSEDKLRNCVADFNTMDLACVVHLGDFIDKDAVSFDVVMPLWNQLTMPKYHVLGNHDFSVADNLKNDVPSIMGMPSKYYDFEIKGWRFVVLDGNDVSFHAYPKDSDEQAAASTYYTQNKITSPKWNGAIGSEQLSWLRAVLEQASQANEKVILLCHFPIYPANNHNLWNAEEVVALLEEFSCVKAYINGHNHKGGYGVKQGIHYITLKGMVDTEQTSYAVISLNEESIHITGFGREEDRTLLIRK